MRRPWREAVLDALQRLSHRSPEGVITRQQIIAEELQTIIRDTQTPAQTPEQSMSYWLQQLRDEGILQFVDGHGQYRLLRPVIDAEDFAGSEEQLDTAILENRLRLGRVETSTALSREKCRRGQARVRDLALENYSNMCSLCDISARNLLVASHIVPWADSIDGRGDLTNVIVLCMAHDSLFEHGYCSIADDLTTLRHDAVNQFWSARALVPDGLRFRAPTHHCPGSEYMAQHRLRHGFGD